MKFTGGKKTQKHVIKLIKVKTEHHKKMKLINRANEKSVICRK